MVFVLRICLVVIESVFLNWLCICRRLLRLVKGFLFFFGIVMLYFGVDIRKKLFVICNSKFVSGLGGFYY